MTTRLLFIALVFISASLSSQINIADSSAQAVAYWTKGDKQVYTITNDKIKLKGTDTVSKERSTYDVTVTVLDAKEKSYTLQWEYGKISMNNASAVVQKICETMQNTKVVYKTDEMGSFKEVVNWKEIRDVIKSGTDKLSKEYSSIPEMDKVIKQTANLYSSKEAIENGAIKDIQQFHSFHGGKYKLGEIIEGKIQVANIFGGAPFDATMQVYLDEMDVKENNFLLRSFQETDIEQLTNATLAYLAKMAETMHVKAPTKADIKDLKNEIATASLIHDSGWNVYTIQTVTVSSDNVTQVEERIIELK